MTRIEEKLERFEVTADPESGRPEMAPSPNPLGGGWVQLSDVLALLAQEDGEPDCDDLCTCGHERFHHEDGREMGVYNHCHVRGCRCGQFRQEDEERMELAEKLREKARELAMHAAGAREADPPEPEYADQMSEEAAGFRRAADLLCGGEARDDDAVVLSAIGLSGILEWRSGKEKQENVESMIRRLHDLATDLEDEGPLELILRAERSNLRGDERGGGGKENSQVREAPKAVPGEVTVSLSREKGTDRWQVAEADGPNDGIYLILTRENKDKPFPEAGTWVVPERHRGEITDEMLAAGARALLMVQNAARDPENGELSDPEEFVRPILKAALANPGATGEEKLRDAIREWHEYGWVEAVAERAYKAAGDHPRAMAAAIKAALGEGLRQYDNPGTAEEPPQ